MFVNVFLFKWSLQQKKQLLFPPQLSIIFWSLDLGVTFVSGVTCVTLECVFCHSSLCTEIDEICRWNRFLKPIHRFSQIIRRKFCVQVQRSTYSSASVSFSDKYQIFYRIWNEPHVWLNSVIRQCHLHERKYAVIVSTELNFPKSCKKGRYDGRVNSHYK